MTNILDMEDYIMYLDTLNEAKLRSILNQAGESERNVTKEIKTFKYDRLGYCCMRHSVLYCSFLLKKRGH